MRGRQAFGICVLALTALAGLRAEACTRVLYETGEKGFIVGRTMDWMVDPHSDLWSFPEGMQRDGGVGPKSVKWTSKYGSVVSSFENVATVDGMNEKGLVLNMLYLVESDYGDWRTSDKPLISAGAWGQYVLDNFATVAEAVEAMSKNPFAMVAPDLPGGKKAGGHVAISDATGDSAIFEWLGGKLVVHHGAQYTVMTNSPSYDQQLALNTYWETIGGINFLPGTARSADRFARVSWNLDAVPHEKDPRLAVATVFSLVRTVSVPLGLADPNQPNIAATVWRTVSDSRAKRYFFDSSYSPTVFWVDLDKLQLHEGAKPMKLDLSGYPPIAGEASAKFAPAEPFKFLSP